MRSEQDSFGKVTVPEGVLYGPATQLAVKNFPVSGHRMPGDFIRALALVKWACARTNGELGRLSVEMAALIGEACDNIIEGDWGRHFPVDIFQTGSGTSTNMNMNEVLARRVRQIMEERQLSGEAPHPNDDINCGQSSNDIIPSALHVSVALSLRGKLLPALRLLHSVLEAKAVEFQAVIKIGRTHLMDATPMTLGQAFSGYATQIGKAVERVERVSGVILELAVGGTAVGTGLNGHPDFAPRVCALLAEKTGIPFCEAKNHFEAQAARDDCVELAGVLSTVAVSLTKVANDLRLLASGPRCGLGEITLPSLQPGSSIMPGKVNPVMCEMLVQVCMYTMGMSNIVVICGRDGQMELNATLPLITYALHESMGCLANATRTFAEHCVEGIEANSEVSRRHVERSLMLATALNPHIGYDRAVQVVTRAFEENKTLKDILLEEKLMTAEQIDQVLDPGKMIGERTGLPPLSNPG